MPDKNIVEFLYGEYNKICVLAVMKENMIYLKK
jgi:hypothetical protein